MRRLCVCLLLLLLLLLLLCLLIKRLISWKFNNQSSFKKRLKYFVSTTITAIWKATEPRNRKKDKILLRDFCGFFFVRYNLYTSPLLGLVNGRKFDENGIAAQSPIANFGTLGKCVRVKLKLKGHVKW